MKQFNPLDYTDAPEQIRRSRVVDAPIEAVWDVVADHQGMTSWMPMISRVELKTPDAAGAWGEGCERNCQFGPDLLEETVVFWDPPHGYAYHIADMHLVRDHVAHIALAPADGGTRVTWTQYYRPNGNAVKNFVAKRVMMPGVMARALRNLGKKARRPARAAAALLAVAILAAGCAADLRTASIKDDSREPPERTSAERLLRDAVAAQGLDAVDRYATYEVRARDHWRGLLGNVGDLWPWKDGPMALRFTLGDFDGQVEALAGEHAGWRAGLQSWTYYEAEPGGAPRSDVEEDKRIAFGLTASDSAAGPPPHCVVFFELGPRLLKAPVIRAYPPGELGGALADRVFVSWGTERDMDYDQYVVWIGRGSGLIEAVTYTVRDNYRPGAKPLFANIQYDDYRAVGGVLVPFLQTVKMFHPDGVTERGYVHQLTVDEFAWDAFAPEAIRPLDGIAPVGDAKSASR